MSYSMRGELWFNSGINGKNAYLMSNGSLFLNNPISTDAASGYLDLLTPTGHVLIFYILANGTNVEQAFFGTATSSGCEHGASGVLEIQYPSGKRLYQVNKGDAVYNDTTKLIRFCLHCSNPVVA